MLFLSRVRWSKVAFFLGQPGKQDLACCFGHLNYRDKGAKEGQKTNRRTATGKAASARMSTQAANTRILSRFGVRLARLDSKTSR